MHSGWAGKYAGQATMSYSAAGQLAGANGVMVPMGRFYQDDGTEQSSAPFSLCCTLKNSAEYP